MPRERGFRTLAVTVVAYALAMAYVESAVVVYLQAAVGGRVGEIFPLQQPVLDSQALVAIELGRELATMVMLAAVGILAGRSRLEGLAWTAVAFGAWDIGYYAWLYVFSGWPPSLQTTDLLFLVPVPWAGPIWSPIAVSVALVGFGLAAARRLRGGQALGLDGWHVLASLAGGALVIVSYTLDGGRLLDGGLPGPYPWPIFAAGMALAGGAAVDTLRRGAPASAPATAAFSAGSSAPQTEA